jgi:hypothetical protein
MNKPVVFLLILFCFYACDSGDIYPEEPSIGEGRSVQATFTFTHVDSFPQGYKIALAAFQDEIEYPLVSKFISMPTVNTTINLKLINIPNHATSVRLCLLQNDNRRLYSFYTINLPSNTTDIIITETNINLLQYNRIQEQVFRQCVACHGGSDHAGANLYLTPELSYSNLYTAPSQNSPKKRVLPFNVQESFLIEVLTEQGGLLHFNHNTGISSLKNDDIVLLEEWIKNGAKQEE